MSQVTTLLNSFRGTSAFNSDISKWDVSEVTTLWLTFNAAIAFNSDLANWNISKVTSFDDTFNEAQAFNNNIFNGAEAGSTGKVTTMERTFFNAVAFNQDISKLDVSKVTSFHGMFGPGLSPFNQGLWCSRSWQNAEQLFMSKISSQNSQVPPGNRILCCDSGTFLDSSLNLDLLETHTDGSFKVPDSDACSDCVPGRYMQSFKLASSCATCPRNWIAPAYRLDRCAECLTGQFSNDGKSCQRCDAGMFTRINASGTDCVGCVPGQYQDNSIQDECFNCPTGWYQREEKKAFCLPCIRK